MKLEEMTLDQMVPYTVYVNKNDYADSISVIWCNDKKLVSVMFYSAEYGVNLKTGYLKLLNEQWYRFGAFNPEDLGESISHDHWLAERGWVPYLNDIMEPAYLDTDLIIEFARGL